MKPSMKPNMKPRPKAKKGTFKRLIKLLFSFYPVLLPIALICILFSSLISSIPSLFMQKVFAKIEYALTGSLGWSDVSSDIIRTVIILAALYFVSLMSSLVYNQLMAVITQGSLKKFRCTTYFRHSVIFFEYGSYSTTLKRVCQ